MSEDNAPPPQPDMAAATAGQILVAVSEATSRRRLVAALTDHGYEVTGVGSIGSLEVRLGSARARTRLLLLSLSLPGGGLPLVRELRHRQRARERSAATEPPASALPYLPVVILGTRSDLKEVGEERAAALDAGADDYLAMPYETSELLACLLKQQRVQQVAAMARQRGVRLRALHEASLALAGPVPAERDAIASLLKSIVERAVAALGARDGRLVLAEQSAWRDLVPNSGPADGLVLLDHTGQLRRAPQRPAGATVHVLSTGQPVWVPDTGAPTPFGSYAAMAQHGIRALVIFPLRAGGQVLGVISVTFHDRRDLSAEDWEALEVFAAHAGAALQRLQLIDAERRRAAQAEQLAATLARVGGEPDLEGALAALLHGAVALLEGDEAVVHLLDPATGARRIMLRLERAQRTITRSTLPELAEGSFAAALRDGGPAVVVEDFAALDPQTYPLYEQMARRGIHAAVNVPIEAPGRRIGSLHVNHRRPGAYGPADLALAEVLATHAGATVERMRLSAARDYALRQLAQQAEALSAREAEAGDLRELSRAKTELLATVAHELRSPLTVVSGYAQQLRARAQSLQPGAVQAVAERIITGSTRLRRLLDDLVDVEQAERGALAVSPEEFDLVPMLRNLVADFAQLPGGERLTADLPERLTVTADRTRTAQVVSNLITNALRYSSEGVITLRAYGSEQGVRVEVADLGPGIPAAEQQQVWEKFYRGVLGAERDPSGSGIGLGLVKALVEAQGGRVGLDSAPDQGTRFWFELPAPPGDPETGP